MMGRSSHVRPAGGGPVALDEVETGEAGSHLYNFHYSGAIGVDPVNCKPLIYLVGAAGLEPATLSLEG